MSWLELDIALGGHDPAALEDALLEHGAQAITLRDAGDQPLLEPGVGETPLWHDVTLTALFDAAVARERIEAAVAPVVPGASYRWRVLDDRPWEREWLTRFAPQRYGRRLWVIPGDIAPVEPDAANVLLDPGLAFGTGDHETTALCLEWLGDRDDLAGARVLDYGCGSGILAIAALRLGAARAVAVDIDPQALTATRDNAMRNGVIDQLDILPAGAAPPGAFDLVLANILAGPLIDLAPTLAQRLAPGGHAVLSGILGNQADAVADAWSEWIDWAPAVRRGDWVRLAGRRRSAA